MGEKLCWGKPSLFVGAVGLPIGQISLDPIEVNHVDHLESMDRYIDDGVVFPKVHSISFDVPATTELNKLFGELTKKRRFPRKIKKAIKALIAKRYGIRMKKIKFSMK